ncbi:hypothetical protein DAEQUDRAFT_696672 [Daedalea quercina L-15889]|uniref:Chromo domain-containing protein n=1 Tax=Daedalea quercina L-15889 TaxID=1314783 RepID=A0A165MIV9_9APHY|nr:hypothetical protein DAEQUDRAFT_696672 [Daedalea quercina L-15889]
MAERHQTFLRRAAGEERPWTNDEILERYPFTNVFRVYDRTTQYILRHVINKGSQDLHESCFRVILFRMFNKIETWKYLKEQIGELTWADFDVYTYEKVLEANLPKQLKRFRYLKDAHGWLRLFPSMGDFTALQLILDLNMLPHFNWSENEWVALGPGSKACVHKIFGPGVRSHELDAIQWLHATQDEHFSRLGIPVSRRPRLCQSRRPGVTMVDLEHSLCECEKYSRAKHPEIKGKRAMVAKHAFVPDPRRPTADLPLNWLKGPPRAVKLTHPPPVYAAGGKVEWEIFRIVAETTAPDARTPHYVLRWTGYGPDDDTCQPEMDLVEQATDVLKSWRSMKERILTRIYDYQVLSSNQLKQRKSHMVDVPDAPYLW